MTGATDEMSSRGYQHKRFKQRGKHGGHDGEGDHSSSSNHGENDHGSGYMSKPQSTSSIMKPSSYSSATKYPVSPLRRSAPVDVDEVSSSSENGDHGAAAIVTPSRSHDSDDPSQASKGAAGANPSSPVVPRRIGLDDAPKAAVLSIDSRPLGRVSNAGSKAASGATTGLLRSSQPSQPSHDDDLSESGHYSENSKDSSTQQKLSNAMKNLIQPFMTDRVLSPSKNALQTQSLSHSNSAAMVHEPTANGLILSPSNPRSPTKPTTALRYSLKEGKKSMTEEMKDVTDDMVAESHQSKLRAAHSLALKSHGKSSSTAGAPKKSSSSSSSRLDDSYKIFLLLLQPKTKTFELIQLIYSPKDTTVGDIIAMIPANATEEALGKQQYIGLCRPKEREDLLNMDMLASRAGVAETSPSNATARIKLGEILVAIPTGYSGDDVARLSEQILANPKIVKLLKRSDPLAPKSKRRSRRHRSSSSAKKSSSSGSGSGNGSSGSGKRHRRRSNKAVDVLEQHDERDEIEQEQNEQKMRDAMAHAAAKAAAANAAIPESSNEPQQRNGLRMRRMGSIGSYSEKSFTSSVQESLDDSYSSWSKSFEESFSAQSSICSGVSKRATRRKERQARRISILKKTAAVAFGCMIGLFFIDPRGYQAPTESDTVSASPMGMVGIFQTFFLLLTIYKVQRFFRTGDEYRTTQRRCPFLRASAHAMDRFKSRYAKKLAKGSGGGSHGASPTHDGKDALLSKRLRSFSLKSVNHDIGADDDTGSL